jgi:hypothetical protein
MTPTLRNRDDLTAVQAIMLDAMRLWVIQMRRGTNMEARIDERLEQLGAGGASPDLKRFMFALSGGCTRMIEVQCSCKCEVGADEQALLDVLSHAQQLSPFAALQILRGFVTEDGAQKALEAAEGVGAALSLAGRFLQDSDHPSHKGYLTAAFDDAPTPRPTLH